MTSKERVRAAIARQPVDRVPLGFYAVDHDTVERVIGHPTYVRNKIEQQVALWEGRRDEVAQSLKEDTVDFYRRIDCADIILPKEAPVLPPKDYEPVCPKKIGDDRWEDRHGRIYQAVRQVNEIGIVYEPPRPPRTWTAQQFEAPVNYQALDPSCFEALDHVITELGRDRFVCTVTGGVTALTRPGTLDESLLLHALQPEVIHAAARRKVDWQNFADADYLRPGADAAFMEQDLAGTTAPLVSPTMFRDLCLPYFRERVQHVKQTYDQVIFHNCGNNLVLMDMFIEAGIDAYQSLQTNAGMEVGKLKAMFGDRLAFWGGVGVESLIAATPDDVRRDVRTAMDRGAPGGGFILGPSHSIAYGTKYDNFMAMLDEFVTLRERY